MIAKLKLYAIAALGFIAAVFSALFYREKAKRQEGLKEGSERARKTESKATDALVKGLENEQKAVKKAKSNTKRTDFS